MTTALIEIAVYPDGLIVGQRRVQLKLSEEDLKQIAKERGFVGASAIADWAKACLTIDLECIY